MGGIGAGHGAGGLLKRTTWLNPYPNFAALPVPAPPGAAAFTLDTNTPYEFNGVAWIPFAGGGGPSGETVVLTNGDSVPLVIGTPVAVISPGTVQRAVANDPALTRAFGLVFDQSIAPGNSGQVMTDGELIATTSQWDLITGQVGGLTTQAFYYLDPSTPGKLSISAPPSTNTGRFVVQIGQAYAPTSLEVRIQQSILL